MKFPILFPHFAWLRVERPLAGAGVHSNVAGVAGRAPSSRLARAITGQTEGQVNKLKLLKRSMYGRASFELLRRRCLLAA